LPDHPGGWTIGGMVTSILIGVVLLAVLAASVAVMTKDLRGLHRSGRTLTDREVDVAGVTPAGVTLIGNNYTH
jgi:uncharacterized membrane protein YhaH (DUF805 family)